METYAEIVTGALIYLGAAVLGICAYLFALALAEAIARILRGK